MCRCRSSDLTSSSARGRRRSWRQTSRNEPPKDCPGFCTTQAFRLCCSYNVHMFSRDENAAAGQNSTKLNAARARDHGDRRSSHSSSLSLESRWGKPSRHPAPSPLAASKPSRQAPRPHRGAEPGPCRLRRLVLAGGRAHLSLLQSRAVPVRSICRCRRHAVRSRVIRLSKARGRTASTSVLCGYRVLLCKTGPVSFIASCFVPCITCGRALRVYAQTETYATSNKSTSYTKKSNSLAQRPSMLSAQVGDHLKKISKCDSRAD